MKRYPIIIWIILVFMIVGVALWQLWLLILEINFRRLELIQTTAGFFLQVVPITLLLISVLALIVSFFNIGFRKYGKRIIAISMMVTIVLIFLWQLGIFNMGCCVSKTMSGFTALKPLDWDMGASSKFDYVILLNGEDTKITLNSISITGDCRSGVVTTNVLGQTIDSGEGLKIPTTDINLCGTSGKAGSEYKVTLTINYSKTIGERIQDYISVGTLRGIWQ